MFQGVPREYLMILLIISVQLFAMRFCVLIFNDSYFAILLGQRKSTKSGQCLMLCKSLIEKLLSRNYENDRYEHDMLLYKIRSSPLWHLAWRVVQRFAQIVLVRDVDFRSNLSVCLHCIALPHRWTDGFDGQFEQLLGVQPVVL